MGSTSHWVEVDLLRGGARVWTRDPLPPCEYLAHVSRADRRPNGTLWPIRLSQRLPTVAVPLKAGDPDAPLDLQQVLDTAYDRAHYGLSVRYEGETAPPLGPDWGPWARRILEAKGVVRGQAGEPAPADAGAG